VQDQPPTQYVYAMYADVTYSPQVAVSISLTTDGAVVLGSVPENTVRDTTASGANDVQTVSVDAGPANLDVRSTTFSDGNNTWGLGSSSGGDQVKWEFSKDGTNWSTFSAADTLYAFDTNVSQSATRNLYLRITTPTSTSSFAEHSTTVTVVASAP
jgi:hypothetical protein